MELADVDITKTPMEVGPTLHYLMGGVRVDPDSAQSTVPGLFAAGEVAGGMHGSNRLGGNSLSDLLVFGRRAGQYAAEYAKRVAKMPRVDDRQVDEAATGMLAPFERREGENPYAVHADLTETMHELVGIIRTRAELEGALVRIARLRERAGRVGVKGSRVYNPGWHLALDLITMLTASEAVARSALARQESRGGHTRDDFPKPDPEWGKKNVVVRRREGQLILSAEPLPEVPPELRPLIGDDKPTGKVAVAAAGE
jgi:succinate dehydrogenase / fumarate reductase flavoprotein subunit